MTKYKINKTNNKYIIEIEGHAGYANSGNDIVCAAISTAIYMTRNSIEKLEPSYNISNIKLEEGYALFDVDMKYEIACNLLDVLEFTLKDLGKQFPDFIKVKK